MLSALLERVLLETVLGILQTLANLFELLSLNADLVRESVVFLLQFLVLVALFWVQVVKACLVRKVDIVDLLLIGVKLVLHISLLSEESVQMRPLLVVLVLDVHVQSLDILRFRVAAMLVKSQVVIG